MFDHTGHKCAFCNKPFEAGDDVVVCPECGAPYHRSCYQQAGHCVFEEQHGTGFEWKPEPGSEPKEPDLTCPRCGAPTPADSRFCKQCGAAMPEAGAAPQGQAPTSDAERERWTWQMGFMASQFDPAEELDGIPLKDWANFVGRSAPYYLANFKQLAQSGRKVGFSFSALFFGPFYYMFRKMWSWGLIFFGLEMLISLPSFLLILIASGSAATAGLPVNLIQNLALFSNLASLILAAVRSMVALPLYRKHIKKRLDAAYSQFPDAAQRSQAAAALGGTGIVGPALLILLQVLLGLTLGTLAGPGIANVLFNLYS